MSDVSTIEWTDSTWQPITVKHLLTHTAGFSYNFMNRAGLVVADDVEVGEAELVGRELRDGADMQVREVIEERRGRAFERDGLKTQALHGDKSQDERLKALAAFKAGEVDLLVAIYFAFTPSKSLVPKHSYPKSQKY